MFQNNFFGLPCHTLNPSKNLQFLSDVRYHHRREWLMLCILHVRRNHHKILNSSDLIENPYCCNQRYKHPRIHPLFYSGYTKNHKNHKNHKWILTGQHHHRCSCNHMQKLHAKPILLIEAFHHHYRHYRLRHRRHRTKRIQHTTLLPS